LAAAAPAAADRLHPNDQVRVMRALEKLHGSDRAGTDMAGTDMAGTAPWPVTNPSWQQIGDEYDLVYVGLTMARDALNARLVERAAAMAKAGLAEEVEALLARGYDAGLPALQGIGYREFVRVVRGELSAATAVALMQRETVRYAKRQGTWFAREPGVEWLEVTTSMDASAIAARIERRLREGRRP
jgi:tRNA dimethylallyltransferase